MISPRRHYLNFIGRMKGNSGCLHCGDTWNWKPMKVIPYKENGGMFPLCTDCFDTLHITEICGYIRKLTGLWVSQGCSLNKAVKAQLSAMEEAKRMKGEE